MKIKQLDVKGFRSLKDVSWQPGDLNVVIGQNGTGKSNLLRVLEMISASAQGKLSGYIQDAGGMLAILWDGAAESIQFHLKSLSNKKASKSEYSYEVNLARLGASSFYRIQKEIWISCEMGPRTEGCRERKIIDRNDDRITYDGESLIFPDDISEQETVLSLLTSPALSGMRDRLGSAFRKQLAGINVYHDLNVGQNSKIRQATVARFEQQLDLDGQNLSSVLHTLYTTDREFKRKVDAAMRVAFGRDYDEIVFPPAADQRVQLRVRWKTLRCEQSAADLSDGALRFLLLLTILSMPDPPGIIAIDQPETGLHPAMFPIIAEYAIERSLHTQIVFTTHSPQFLDVFTETKPTTTIAKWADGATSLHTVAGEELDYWLADYSLGSLFKSGELEALV